MPNADVIEYGAGTCAVCDQRTRSGYLMCSWHWYQVPSKLRLEVYGALGAWGCGLISLDQLRSVQLEAVKAVHGGD
jgi:hypothetical protein